MDFTLLNALLLYQLNFQLLQVSLKKVLFALYSSQSIGQGEGNILGDVGWMGAYWREKLVNSARLQVVWMYPSLSTQMLVYKKLTFYAA